MTPLRFIPLPTQVDVNPNPEATAFADDLAGDSAIPAANVRNYILRPMLEKETSLDGEALKPLDLGLSAYLPATLREGRD